MEQIDRYMKRYGLDGVLPSSVRPHLMLVRYAPGEAICIQGAEAEQLHFLVSGKIRVAHTSAAGKRLVLSFKYPLDLIRRHRIRPPHAVLEHGRGGHAGRDARRPLRGSRASRPRRCHVAALFARRDHEEVRDEVAVAEFQLVLSGRRAARELSVVDDTGRDDARVDRR